MTPGELFIGTVAVTAGITVGGGIGYLAVALVLWISESLDAITAALRRYAVRDEIVVESYYPEQMEHRRLFREPKPDRVRLARKGEFPSSNASKRDRK